MDPIFDPDIQLYMGLMSGFAVMDRLVNAGWQEATYAVGVCFVVVKVASALPWIFRRLVR